MVSYLYLELPTQLRCCKTENALARLDEADSGALVTKHLHKGMMDKMRDLSPQFHFMLP